MSNEVADRHIQVGTSIKVFGFLWVTNFIGYDHDAKHMHNLDPDESGSFGTGCTLIVRDVLSDGMSVVSLSRPYIPRGAEAAIGTVFMIETAKLREWVSGYPEAERMELKAARMRAKYLR